MTFEGTGIAEGRETGRGAGTGAMPDAARRPGPRPRAAILLVRWRGEVVEGERAGHVAVVDAAGRLVASAGDPSHVTFMRSAAKPFQAMPLLLSGAMERFGLGPRELALACASHVGSPAHVETARGMLAKIGLGEEALECGVHDPISAEALAVLYAAGATASAVHNNCSGNHAGMLAACRARGFATAGYRRADHPIQKEILGHMAAFTGVAPEEVRLGIDGCGVPCFALPLERMAAGYARLAEGREPDGYARAAARVREAMTAHPDLVAGPGRTSTEIMRAFPGRILSKGGAQGVLCGALLEEGLGYAVKLADASSENMILVAARLLEELDVPGVSERLRDEGWHEAPITNHIGERVGSLQAVFRLTRA